MDYLWKKSSLYAKLFYFKLKDTNIWTSFRFVKFLFSYNNNIFSTFRYAIQFQNRLTRYLFKQHRYYQVITFTILSFVKWPLRTYYKYAKRCNSTNLFSIIFSELNNWVILKKYVIFSFLQLVLVQYTVYSEIKFSMQELGERLYLYDISILF